jgi:3-deoxy-D-manno-octulosonic-acid transferase
MSAAVIHACYTAGLTVALAAYAPVAVYRRLARGARLNLRERLGLDATPGHGRAGWVHAVSVGEALAAATLLHGLRRTYPDLPLVVTTVTETGARIVRDRFAGLATHRFFPLDFPGPVRRVAAAIDPLFFVGMETEIWPNTLRTLAARGVPVMIANGRVSDRSFPGYRRVRRLMRPVLEYVRVFAMRSDEDARRIIALGAPPERVFVTGNLKHEPLPDSAGLAALWRRLLGLQERQPIWIAGSTHAGEEEVVLDAHRRVRATHPGLVLAIAPRRLERVDTVVRLAGARGLTAVRRSQLPRAGSTPDVIVVDTIGELAQMYTVAEVVFVGGSLVPHGGQNMLEAALRSKPTLYGPHTANFREAAALLVEVGAAAIVHDGPDLARILGQLLADPEQRARWGAVGYEAVVARHGAVKETLALIDRFLMPPATR